MNLSYTEEVVGSSQVSFPPQIKIQPLYILVEQLLALLRFEKRDKLPELPIDLNRSSRNDFIVNVLAGLIVYYLHPKVPALQFVADLIAISP